MWLGKKKKKFLSHIHNLDNIHMLCDLIVKIQNCFRGRSPEINNSTSVIANQTE